MGKYTKSLSADAKLMVIDDDTTILYDIAKRFRTFDEAMTEFIEVHGYDGDLYAVSAKTKFVRGKFRENCVDELRNFKDLFSAKKGIDREYAFRICFAFNLSIKESNDFFKRVMLERGIDCHTIKEAVYYFCIRNNLSFCEAKSIAKTLEERISVEKDTKKLPDSNILYTNTIKNYIERISEVEDLIRYIEENKDSFEYKNVTAIKFIQKLWEKITGADGLAIEEGKLIDKALNPLHPDQNKKTVGDTREDDVIKADIAREKELMEDDFVISTKSDNKKDYVWTIYCQIMGLDNHVKKIYSTGSYDRSLASVFKDNVLLPLCASKCFPSRQKIGSIIRGEYKGEYESFRKTLIFLVFYTYWAKYAVRNSDIFYVASSYERSRCKAQIDNYLVEAGYHGLYEGNPYDWIFLWALNDEYPLDSFRFYMREVYIAKFESQNNED